MKKKRFFGCHFICCFKYTKQPGKLGERRQAYGVPGRAERERGAMCRSGWHKHRAPAGGAGMTDPADYGQAEEPRSGKNFAHCRNLQKEKHIDEISYSGIRSGIFTGSALWRSLFSAPSHPGNRLADSEDRKDTASRQSTGQFDRERGGGAQTGKTSGGDRFTVYGNAVGTDFIRCLCDASGTGSGHRSGHDLPDSGGEVSSGGEQQGVETIERREPGGSQKSGIHDRREGHGTSDRGRRGKGGH